MNVGGEKLVKRALPALDIGLMCLGALVLLYVARFPLLVADQPVGAANVSQRAPLPISAERKHGVSAACAIAIEELFNARGKHAHDQTTFPLRPFLGALVGRSGGFERPNV